MAVGLFAFSDWLSLPFVSGRIVRRNKSNFSKRDSVR